MRAGQVKKPSGFQADLVCLTPWVNGEAPAQITCLTVNSSFSLMAYGNGSGLVVVDYIQHKCLLNMGTADLYGSNDPFQRMPRSPRQLDPEPGMEDLIKKVDLANFSQINTGEEKEEEAGVNKVKSPAAKSLSNRVGTGSSAEEGSISKSRSSSVNSLDCVVEGEGVTSVLFADSFPSKNEWELAKCLYVGTSLGSVLVIVIVIPDTPEARYFQIHTSLSLCNLQSLT